MNSTPLPGIRPVSLLDVGTFQCRWPVDVNVPGYFFCGAAVDPEAARPCWCDAHKGIGFGSGTQGERSALRTLKALAA